MSLQGHVDRIVRGEMLGWAHDRSAPRRRIELFVWIDGRYHGRLLANRLRDDLVRAGIGDGRYAFSIRLPTELADGRLHSIRIAGSNGWEPTGSPLDLVGCAAVDGMVRARSDVDTGATLLAIAKNEAPYIEEWIAHHHALGFHRIVVYDNDSDDGTGALLRNNPRLNGLVEVVAWPSSGYGSDKAPQLAAYDDALARLDRCGWLAVLDLDEFLVLRHDRTVQQFLARYSDLDAIAIGWRIFGSGGRDRYEPGPVTRRFRHSGPARLVKSLARLDRIAKIGIHAPILLNGTVQDELRRPLAAGGRLVQPSARHVQISHYFCKSREEWRRKRQRGRPDRPAGPGAIRIEADFARHDLAETIDDTVSRHWPATIASMEQLFPDTLETWRQIGVFAQTSVRS